MIDDSIIKLVNNIYITMYSINNNIYATVYVSIATGCYCNNHKQ